MATTYPSLTPAQKSTLIARCNTYPDINRLAYHIRKGELSFDELTSLTPARRSQIDAILNQPVPPDPNEQADWAMLSSRLAGLETMGQPEMSALANDLLSYAQKYEADNPQGNHCSEARAMVNEIGKRLDAQVWNQVDSLDFNSLTNFIMTHPASAYAADADGCLWDIISNGMNMYYLSQYISVMQPLQGSIVNLQARESVSMHLSEAQKAQFAYNEWQNVKCSNDIVEVHRYLQSHSDSPFKNDIQITLNILKPRVFEDFKAHLRDVTYIDKYFYLTENGIISENEFKAAGIVSDGSLARMGGMSQLAPINQDHSDTESPEGCTDVFLFGIPSTGKTCLIMGLLDSPLFNWDSVRYSGKYGQQLQEYCSCGKTPGSTFGNFVAVINGKIKDKSDKEIFHPVNLIDMAGETFANKIASNPDSEISFEDMGEGATQILANKNQKVFFIVVDPTEDVVGGGVSQKNTLTRMIDLFNQPENKEVMERVQAIHFIVTKTDRFDCGTVRDDPARNEAARARMKNYNQALDKMAELCGAYNQINQLSRNLPKLYTFSLGRFYLGDIFDYDPSDSDKIMNLISYITGGKRKNSFFDKVIDALNYPIF